MVLSLEFSDFFRRAISRRAQSRKIIGWQDTLFSWRTKAKQSNEGVS